MVLGWPLLREGLRSLELFFWQWGRQGVSVGLRGGSPGSFPSASLAGDEVGSQLSWEGRKRHSRAETSLGGGMWGKKVGDGLGREYKHVVTCPAAYFQPQSDAQHQQGDGRVSREEDGDAGEVCPHRLNRHLGRQEDSGVGVSLTHVAVDEG